MLLPIFILCVFVLILLAAVVVLVVHCHWVSNEQRFSEEQMKLVVPVIESAVALTSVPQDQHGLVINEEGTEVIHKDSLTRLNFTTLVSMLQVILDQEKARRAASVDFRRRFEKLRQFEAERQLDPGHFGKPRLPFTERWFKLSRIL